MMRILIVTLLLLVGSSAFPSDGTGGTGAPFLMLAVGARESAMAGAVVAAELDANALFWNPAGLVGIQYPQVTFNHSEHLLETRYDAVAAARKFENIGSVGAGVLGFFTGGLEKRTGPSDEPQASFGGYNLCFNLGYGRKMSSALSSGLNAKIVYEKMEEYTSTAFAFDAGISYLTNIKRLKVAAALQNIGTMTRFRHEPFSLPASFKVGVSYVAKEDVLMVASEILKPFQDAAEYRLGGELKIGESAHVRAGYRTGFTHLGGVAGFVAGAGFGLNQMTIDYAVDPYGPLGISHKISVSYSFGKSEGLRREKERLIAGELSKKARITAESFHTSALSYYTAGRTEEAITAWDMALVWDPTFTEAKTMLQKAREEIKDQTISAHLEKANGYMDDGDFVDALSEFSTVLDLDPENTLAKRMFETASNFITRLELEKEHKGPTAAKSVAKHYNKAASLYAQKRYFEAISEWQEVLELNPHHRDAKTYISRAKGRMREETRERLKVASDHIARKNWLTALKEVRTILRMNPEDSLAARKESEIRKGLKLAAEDRLQAGIKFFKAKEFTQAEEQLRMALKFDPDNAAANEYMEKVRTSRSSITQEEVTDLYLKGIGAYTSDNLETAVFYWQKVLELDPDHENARKNLDRALAKISRLNSE